MEKPPTIEFPCDYPIKVIGDDSPGFAEAVLAIVGHHDPSVDASRFAAKKSSKGTYVSYTITLTATGEDQLTALFEDLKQITGVRMVL